MRTIYSVIVLSITLSFNMAGQDSLDIGHLERVSHTFDIVDGRLLGDGKSFLEGEMERAQFTMIGEYHGSRRISEFTNAIIPVLDRADYKTMALEVGPITGEVLNALQDAVEKDISTIHNTYAMSDADGDIMLPFPFFDTKEDARFLQTAKTNSWNIFGIDQEYYDGYVMLADKMFSNLPKALKENYNALYKQTKETLKKYYKDDQSDQKNLHMALSNSQIIENFLNTMKSVPKNIPIIEAFRKSSSIYLLNHKRQWYENNATRVKYMKAQLRAGLQNLDFDLSKEKMLIKMGGYHLSKGFSPLSIYEVGNTLNEIAEYYGNTALNIGFMTRYYKDGDTIKDSFESTNGYLKARRNFLQMGQQNQWVVIDLRQLIKDYYYYPQKFKLNTAEAELIQRYDLLIIPKLEVDGTPNYQP